MQNESTFAENYKLMFDIKEILTASLILFAVINILGSVPLIITLREKVGRIESEKASIHCSSDYDRLFVFGGGNIKTHRN